jgi:hypothetical protein
MGFNKGGSVPISDTRSVVFATSTMQGDYSTHGPVDGRSTRPFLVGTCIL